MKKQKRRGATRIPSATFSVVKPKRRDDEHKLQVGIIELINLGKSHPDIIVMAIPNAAKRSTRTGLRMRNEGLMPGAPDLAILLPEAKTAWMEAKTEKGRQSDVQMGFEARCKRLGHPYALVHSIDEAVVALREMGVLR